MMVRTVGLAGLVALGLWTAGCTGVDRVDLAERTGGTAALYGQFQAYDGHSGGSISFAELVRRCRKADVVFFGEQHGDTVCNQLEAQLLYALARERRPMAVAMEFFEADTQATLDAYLRGRIAEPPFRERARQGHAYVLSHRPIIELCRTAHIPVVAANAPRRLVSGYRKSGLEYGEYRATLEPEEQRWLPTANEYVGGSYEERFFDLMSGHEAAGAPGPTTMPASMPTMMPVATAPASQPASAPATASAPSGEPQHPAEPTTQPVPPATQPTSMPTTAPAETPHPPPVSQPVASMPTKIDVAQFYRSQLLWDQTMAESLADFRDSYATRRVMLIVGGFHVMHDGGTVTKFRRRRPDDRVITIVYRGTEDGRFEFDPEDRDAADIVIYGINPPSEKMPAGPPGMPATQTAPAATQPAGETPASAPATAPTASAPAETQPASGPATEEPAG